MGGGGVELFIDPQASLRQEYYLTVLLLVIAWRKLECG